MSEAVTKLTAALLEDLEAFDKCYHEAIVYIYLHKAYVQGDQEAWAKALDDSYKDSECELEEPFDSDFFGGEK